MDTTVKFYSLDYRESRTYLYAALFLIGNIVLPQLIHLLPHGGLIWLPIYFFTLIGAYKYGWQVGLLTAVASPLVNHGLFGMPAAPMLVPILVKSVVLALAASYAAHRYQKVSIPVLAAVVLAYQAIGSAAEWMIVGNPIAALQDFRIGIPGMMLQLFGGYATIKYLLKK